MVHLTSDTNGVEKIIMEYKGVFLPPKSKTYLLWNHSAINKHEVQKKIFVATRDVMREDAIDDVFCAKMNLFVDGIGSGASPCNIFYLVTALEQKLREDATLREAAERHKPVAAAAAAVGCCQCRWEACPWMDLDNRLKVPLHKAITTTAKKVLLDPWLVVATYRLHELAQNGISLETIAAQEYAI